MPQHLLCTSLELIQGGRGCWRRYTLVSPCLTTWEDDHCFTDSLRRAVPCGCLTQFVIKCLHFSPYLPVSSWPSSFGCLSVYEEGGFVGICKNLLSLINCSLAPSEMLIESLSSSNSLLRSYMYQVFITPCPLQSNDITEYEGGCVHVLHNFLTG